MKVAYFGGSITAQAGWRVQSLDLLRRLYPRTTFEEVYAPIGGTGSNTGVYRLQQDVIRYHPDLVFVEFAVNDSGAPAATIRNSMEGIVRSIWSALPGSDIAYVYTLPPPKLKILQSGKCWEAATVHEEVAEYYGIPSIHMAMEVARLEKEGRLEMLAPGAKYEPPSGGDLDKATGLPVNAQGRIPFGDVHPYLNTGHKLYTAAIERSLPKIKAVSKAAGPHTLPPKPLSPDYVRGVNLVEVSAAKMEGEWTKVAAPAGKSLGEPSARMDLDIYVPSVWRATPGSTLSFDFKGRSVMLYTLKGPGTGYVEVTVDGQSSKHLCFDGYSVYWRLSPFFPVAGLDSEKIHTLTVKVLPEMPDKRALVAAIKREKGYDDNPAAFRPTDLVIGAICIEDGAIIAKAPAPAGH